MTNFNITGLGGTVQYGLPSKDYLVRVERDAETEAFLHVTAPTSGHAWRQALGYIVEAGWAGARVTSSDRIDPETGNFPESVIVL